MQANVSKNQYSLEGVKENAVNELCLGDALQRGDI